MSSGPRPEPVAPATGWGVLHLFCKAGPAVDAEAVVGAVKAAQGDDHQVVSFAVLGHKADLGFLALGPDLWRLRALQTALTAAGLVVTDSYVSLTEVSEYAKGMPAELLNPRLYPKLPPEGMPAICFYPMSKRRTVEGNWYTLPYDDRERLMFEHGTSGRAFKGRVLQLVTGSTGLDDWEWGVTLFAVRPDDLKECVHSMRFDEASAVYAEFGPFTTGLVGEIEQILAQAGMA
ncbi:MAG TPA: chlorite dismutase family protein [Acidimicrobiales bacterium]|nr:chlorite dismutase family protein [Acidimicrobiales bacterium]